MAINIQVIKDNSLNIPRGLYLEWMGNAKSDAVANQLIAENAAAVVNNLPPYSQEANFVFDSAGNPIGLYNPKDGSTVALGGGGNVSNSLNQAIRALKDGLRTRPVIVLGIGDSNFTGEGAGTSGSNMTNGAFRNNPIRQISDVISSIGGLPIINTAFIGEGNVLSPGGTVTGYDPRIVMTGGWAAGAGPIFMGGRQLVTSSTVGELTFTPGGTGDVVEVYTFQNSAGSTSVDVLSSDGVVRGNFSCNSADAVLSSTLQRFTFTGSAFKDGIIRFQNKAAGDATIFGCFTYPSDVKCVLMVKASYCTGTSANFAATTGTYSGVGYVPVIQPDYAITQITINDIITTVATATYSTNLTNVYNVLRKQCDVLSTTGGIGGSANYLSGLYKDYELVLAKVASLFNSPLISFHKRDDNWAACNAKGYEYNNHHKTQLGYLQQSVVIAAHLASIA